MSHPTYEALLKAGLNLANTHGLSQISINDIVKEAKVAKGTFYVHFADRKAYLVELHRWFHEHLKTKVQKAMATLPAGFARLLRGTEVYLDECLQARAVKALLLEARGLPEIAEEVKRRNTEFAEIAAQDLAAMGFANPMIGARLYVVMAAEVALIELDGRNQVARQTLIEFIQHK